MPNSALIGLAYLNVAWRQEGQTYIDNFLPMACEAVRASDEEIVTEPAVKQGILNQFGLDLPRHTIGTLIRRAHRRGFLTRDNYTFLPNHEALEVLDFSTHREGVQKLYAATVDRLVEYCIDELGIDWTRDQADEALQSYLSEYSLDVMLSSQRHSVVSKPQRNGKERLIVSLYIRHLQEEDSGVFELIADLFQGAMLANALFVSDPERIEHRFGDTKVFLDSPLLLAAAGYGFDDRVRPTQELVEFLQDLGADLATFRLTVEEARGILVACATIMRQGAYSDADDPVRENIDYFYSQSMTSTDVDRLAANLDDKLEFLGFSIEHRPEISREEWEFQVDIEGLEAHLEAELHQRPEARRHDAEVISNIARLRRGQPQNSLEHCEAIFATHNTGLARASRDYFQDERLQGSVALTITDYHLTNIAWLKSPTAAPDLPLKSILADCHAAIQPSEELWDAFLREVEHLRDQGEITLAEYVAVRHSREGKTALAEVTLGDVDSIADGTVTRVLERAQRRKHRELVREQERREELESRLGKRTGIDRQRLTTVAEWTSRLVGWGTVVVGLVLLGVGVFATLPGNLPALREAIPNYIVSSILLFMFVFLFWAGFFGLGWLHVSEWMQRKTFRLFYQRLLKWWQLDTESEELPQ